MRSYPFDHYLLPCKNKNSGFPSAIDFLVWSEEHPLRYFKFVTVTAYDLARHVGLIVTFNISHGNEQLC